MTDEEIKKLAEECSLYYQGRPAKRGYELSNRLTIESYALMTLKWLSERYCIVPKVEVLNQHAWYMQRMKEVSSNRQMNRGKAIALENLFGKDMFKEIPNPD